MPALLMLGFLASCKPKDADIKTAVEEKIKSLPNAAGITVDVKDGVATLNGSSSDDATKSQIEAAVKETKDVKSVTDNIVVTPPVVDNTSANSPVSIAGDDVLTKGVADAVKDFPGVKASVKNGVISLAGTIKRASLAKLMMALNSLKPKSFDNKLVIQ